MFVTPPGTSQWQITPPLSLRCSYSSQDAAVIDVSALTPLVRSVRGSNSADLTSVPGQRNNSGVTTYCLFNVSVVRTQTVQLYVRL